MRSLFDFAVPLLLFRKRGRPVSDDSVDPQGDKFPHSAFIVDRPHVHLHPGPAGSSYQLAVNNAQAGNLTAIHQVQVAQLVPGHLSHPAGAAH